MNATGLSVAFIIVTPVILYSRTEHLNTSKEIGQNERRSFQVHWIPEQI